MNYYVTHGIPVGVWMIGNDVVTAGHQTFVDAGQEGVRLWGAEDALQWGTADLSHTLCAALQEEGQQSAHNLWRIQLLCAEETDMQNYWLMITVYSWIHSIT